MGGVARMIYFKANDGAVFAYESMSDKEMYGSPGLVEMTREEVAAHLSMPQLTPEQTIEVMRAAIQAHMDTAAKGYGYDDIKAAVTYADEPAVPKFQAEGRAFRAWRSLVWAHAYGVLDQVKAGAITQPTEAEMIAGLPKLIVEYEAR